ncbi:MAG: branched-chain amino acid ABC transporter permease [Rhodospirillales bacterium]|nr:MAG: branched-chain amino acid ABC transporter permease [Rhodospirillales bacterium]
MSPAGPEARLLLAVGVGFVGLAAFPWLGSEFYVDLVVRLMILAIFAMSLDLLIGYTGLVSFGHAAFFGIAGYTLAMLTPAGAPADLVVALPAALLASALAAAVIGFLSLRTAGVGFIMITLAFAQMLYYFASESSALGGSDGLLILFRPELAVGGRSLVDLEDPTVFYYLVLACLAGVLLLLKGLVRAPFGRVIRAIRIDDRRTRALGFATRRYKLASFVIAGTLAGLAGFLEAAHGGYVSPGHLGWHQSGLVMMVVILGGMGTVYGPLLAAFAFGLLQDQVQDWTAYTGLAVGVFVIAVVLLLPRGLAGLVAGRSRQGGRLPP